MLCVWDICFHIDRTNAHNACVAVSIIVIAGGGGDLIGRSVYLFIYPTPLVTLPACLPLSLSMGHTIRGACPTEVERYVEAGEKGEGAVEERKRRAGEGRENACLCLFFFVFIFLHVF